MNPQEFFLQDNHRDPTGWDAISPVRTKSERQVRIGQLHKEYLDLADLCEERGEYTEEDYTEMRAILDEIDLLMEVE